LQKDTDIRLAIRSVRSIQIAQTSQIDNVLYRRQFAAPAPISSASIAWPNCHFCFLAVVMGLLLLLTGSFNSSAGNRRSMGSTLGASVTDAAP
jgi:hypothetical protein